MSFQGVELENVRAVLERAYELYPNIAIASSFGLEDVALIHQAMEVNPSARVFSLDTGRLHEETYSVAERIREKYGIEVEWYFPERDQVEKLERAKGLYSFRESLDDRRECCGVRKIAPLKRALKGLDAWVTGQRREQGVTRTDLNVVEMPGDGPVKINPLASWTSARTLAYVKEFNIPYNELFDRGYASIGCAPCTRPIEEGEDERAGRWWWENPEHKECGLHGRREK